MEIQPKTILIYTALFNSQEWPNFKSIEGDIFLKKHGCPVTNCRLMYNIENVELSNADIVVFHDRDMPNSFTLKLLNDTVRPKDQIWVYFTGENPLHSTHNVAYLDDLFDWTMTYKLDSSVWLPYFRYHDKKFETQKSLTNYAKSKKKLIAWLASDCGLMRERIVYELQQLLPVHVGGHCSRFFPDKLDCKSTEECDNKIKEYKFYLAFENKLCDDYITEKYWYRAIRNGVIPIVLGSGLYINSKLVIPGSYINVLDFKNIKILARYIKYLDNNDTAYNEYFKWKDKYVLWEPICDWPFEPYWACQMCMRLNIGIQRKRKVKMSKYWNAGSDCKSHEKYLQLFLENSGHDFQDFQSRRKLAETPYNRISKELDYEETSKDREKDVEVMAEDIEDENVKANDKEDNGIIYLSKYGNTENEEYNILALFSFALIGFMLFIFKMR